MLLMSMLMYMLILLLSLPKSFYHDPSVRIPLLYSSVPIPLCRYASNRVRSLHPLTNNSFHEG